MQEKFPSPQETAAGYDQIAEWFSRSVTHEYGMNYLEKFMAMLPSKAGVIDLGCGNGRMCASLIKNGFAATGVDLSERMLNIARKRVPGAVFVRSEAMRYCPAAPADGIVAWDSLFHLSPESHVPSIAHMASILKPGGLLLYTSGRRAGAVSGVMNGVRFHYSSLSRRRLGMSLKENGFEIVVTEEDSPDHLVTIARRSGQ